MLIFFFTLFASGVLGQYTLNVTNNCPWTLYLVRTLIDENSGKVSASTALSSGGQTTVDVSGWVGQPGQRLYAYWDKDPVSTQCNSVVCSDKVEINVCGTGPTEYCYNPTAVDYFSLPVNIGPNANNNCPGIPFTGYGNISSSSIQPQCPTYYQSDDWGVHGVCQSAGYACAVSANNVPSGYCSALDSVISQCVSDGNCGSGTTEEVYGCSGWFATQPQQCSAINRGMYYTSDHGYNQDDDTQFYKTTPYNTYSAWIHQTYAKEYAFPYDDYGASGESGYNSCETDILDIVWCPSG